MTSLSLSRRWRLECDGALVWQVRNGNGYKAVDCDERVPTDDDDTHVELDSFQAIRLHIRTNLLAKCRILVSTKAHF